MGYEVVKKGGTVSATRLSRSGVGEPLIEPTFYYNKSMSGWSPLWSMIVDSSLWSEPDYVCKIFVTMLALKDGDHVVRLTAYQLAHRSHKTEAEVLEALKILSSPDKKRLEPQEHDGRRISKVPSGWLVLNGEKYREMIRGIRRREYQAKWQKGYRERQKNGDGVGSDAAVPTFEEVKEHGARSGVVFESCKSFYDHHENNNLWFNRFGKQINWQKKLVTWGADKRQDKFTQPPTKEDPAWQKKLD